MSDELLGELLSDTREVVRRLLEEPLGDPAGLRRELERHVAVVKGSAGAHSLADWRTGLDVCERADQLLARWPVLDHRGRRLVQVAVRYLVLEEDGAPDLGSPFGFDDDLEVVDAVERALGSAR